MGNLKQIQHIYNVMFVVIRHYNGKKKVAVGSKTISQKHKATRNQSSYLKLNGPVPFQTSGYSDL